MISSKNVFLGTNLLIVAFVVGVFLFVTDSVHAEDLEGFVEDECPPDALGYCLPPVIGSEPDCSEYPWLPACSENPLNPPECPPDALGYCFPPEIDPEPDCSAFPWLAGCPPTIPPECDSWLDCLPPDIYFPEIDLDNVDWHSVLWPEENMPSPDNRPNPIFIFIYGGQNSGWGTVKPFIYDSGAGGGGGGILNIMFIYEDQNSGWETPGE